MTYFNRTGNEFAPVAEFGPDYRFEEQPEKLVEIDGLYFRSRIYEGLTEDVEQCASGVAPYSSLSLDAYQAKVEVGWKAEHGTYAAAKRWYEKGYEEVVEFDEAVEDYVNVMGLHDDISAETDHVVEEAGDNLFIAVARSSNSGNVSSDSVKARAIDYAFGTKVITADGRGYTEPDWYDATAQFAIMRGSPTVGDVDNLITSGFVPRISPAMNLYEEEEYSLVDAVMALRLYSATGGGMGMRQYGYGETDLYASPAVHAGFAADIGKITAETYFHVAAIAHYVGRTLADVIAMNVAKVSRRVETRTVDRTDGPRP